MNFVNEVSGRGYSKWAWLSIELYIIMMTCHYSVLLVFSCSSMVVLGVELSCNQSSTTCPGDVVQCQCVASGALE